MDEETANRFVSSLVKSIQALCNGYIDFSTSIEVIGHIHLNIDHNLKFNYILTEEVSKSVSEGATVFASHSYHSQPPPSVSSKTAGDASSRNRRKSHHVTQSNETDPLGITSLPAEVPNTSKSKSDNHSQGASRVGESSDSSQSGTGVSQDTDSVKQENNRSSCQVQESLDRRRRNALPSHRTPSPAAKRSRNNDTGSSTSVQNPGFDVIEIKEEPDDEPSVFFGDNSSHMAVGQDIQTPDFSNVVMESLDRVGQIEGNQLVAGGDSMQQQQQQQPFPVMLHTNAGIPSSTMSSSGGQAPGPSSDPRSAASTSGVMGVDQGMSYNDWCDLTSASFRQHVFNRQIHPLHLHSQSDSAGETFTELREKRRLQKQKYRSRLTEEQRRKINLMERERYARRRATNNSSSSFYF